MGQKWLFWRAWVLAAVFALPAAGAEVDSESFAQLKADVAALSESRDALVEQLRSLQKQLAQARAEIVELKQQLAASQSRDSVGRDDLKKLADQMQELDRRRVEDAKFVRNQLEELAKLIASRPPPPDPDEPRAGHGRADGDEALPSEFLEHVVQPGETLGAIVAAYNRDRGLKLKVSQVLRANPKIKDPARLAAGVKIRIPVVK